ncbi:MAG: hypothetical protein P4M09_01430 [Devosia sp.]|nr:hypothetical protein [Devosia sp.]
MLRGIILFAGGFVLVGGLIAMAGGAYPPGLAAVALGVLTVVGTAHERIRYKPVEPAAPGPGWEATNERFIDNDTGKTVTVYVERGTGERKYVTE